MTRKNPETGIHEESSFGMFWDPQYADGKMIRTNKESGVCEESRWGLAWDPHLKGDPIRNLPQAEYVNYSDNREDQQSRELMEIDIDSQLNEIKSSYEGRCYEIESRFEDMQDYRDSVYEIESKMSDIEMICKGTSHALGQLRIESGLGTLITVSYLQELLDGQGDIKDALSLVLEGQRASDALQLAISANSLEEADYAWSISPAGSRAESVAGKKWDDFALQQIKMATTLAEAKSAYRGARKGSLVENLAMDKLNFFVVESETVVKDARINYEDLYSDSPVKELAKKKWESLALQQLSEAKTMKEVQQLLVDAPPDGQAKLFGEEKKRFFPLQEMIDNANTVDEAWRLFQEFPEGSKEKAAAYDKFRYLAICALASVDSLEKAKAFFEELHDDPSVKEIAKKKWESIALTEVNNIETLAELNDILNLIPPCGAAWQLVNAKIAIEKEKLAKAEADREAIRKELVARIEGARSVREVRNLLPETPEYGGTRHFALRKWNELSLGEVKAAKTIKEIECALKDTLPGSNVESIAQKKLLMFRIEAAKSAKEAKAIFEEIPVHDEMRQIALKKWNELSWIQVNSAKTLGEAKQSFDDAPPDCKAREVAAQNWESVAIAAVNAMNTLGELKCILRFLVFPDGTVQQLVKEKIMRLESEQEMNKKKHIFLARIEEARTANELKLMFQGTSGDDGVAQAVLKKWHELSLREATVAKTIKEVEGALAESPVDSEAESIAFEKMIVLCIDKAVRQSLPYKWNQFSLDEVLCRQANEDEYD